MQLSPNTPTTTTTELQAAEMSSALSDGAALTGGFDDAPRQSARNFRAVMTAMARPGEIASLHGAQPPAPLSPAAGCLALVVLDQTTPVYLAPSHDTPALRAWITFHTAAPIVADPASASFAIGSWQALGDKSRYRIGTPEYPCSSATLIVEQERLMAQGSVLRGPGIKDVMQLNLPEPALLQANAAQYPLGFDLFLTSGNQIAGLPRSTKIAEA